MAADARAGAVALEAPGRPSYRHVQFGRAVALRAGIALVLATAGMAALSRQTLAAAPWLVVALYAIIALYFALFCRLAVSIEGGRLRLVFGIGLLRREVALAEVLRADRVRTRLWWRYGIQWTPSGWLYNVSGRDAVRLELRHDKPVMVGTDEPDALLGAIAALGQGNRQAKEG